MSGGVRIADVVVGLFMVAAGAVAVFESFGLPAPSFEPVGPAAFPRIAGLGVALFGLAVLAGAVRAKGGSRGPGEPLRWDLVGVLAALTALYVGAMTLDLVGFRIATVAYLFLLGITCLGLKQRPVLITLVLALVLGVGCHLLFTQFFFIDLP